MSHRRIVAVVPLRIGSSRVLRKNIRPLLGKPLASYMIRALNEAELVHEVYVSTSSDEIDDALHGHCDYTRVHRPEEMSTSTSCVPEIFMHAAEEAGLEDDDIILRVDATYPFLKGEWIDECILKLLDEKGAECSILGKAAERPEFTYHVPKGESFLTNFYLPEAVRNGLDWSEYVQAVWEPNNLIYGAVGIEAYYFRVLKQHRNPWMKVPTVAVTIPAVHGFSVDTPEDWEMVQVVAEYLYREQKAHEV